MSNALINSITGQPGGNGRRFPGIAVVEVKSNLDSTGMGRVQVHVPWLPEADVWARVAMPSAGKERGMYFIPQVGDEVLVIGAFGDVGDLFVIGSLWGEQDKPPTRGINDPKNKRMIKTPGGHVMEFDDQAKKITVTNAAKHTITIDQKKTEIAMQGGKTKVTLTSAGDITLEGQTSITLKAPSITLDGTTVEVKGSGSTTLKSSGGVCTISGTFVKIN